MKAIVTLAAGLILVSTTFAQSSRRSEVKENDNQNNRRSETTVSSERRAPSQSRTEVSSTNRRGSETQSTEKRAEANTDNQRSSETTVNTERRAPSQSSDSRTESSTNRRSTEPATEQRTVVGSNTPSAPSNPGTQDRSSVTNRRNPSSDNRNNGYNESNSKPGNSSTRTYSNNRREPSGNRDQVIVHEHNRRTVEPRHHTVVHKSYRPVPVEVRRVKYPYRPPVRTEIIWTVDLSRRFEVYYPAYRPYRYHVGMRLATVSAYDAYNFVGEIARVYGRVAETYYSWETDEYFLYVGDYYPYQDFSIIIPGREARDFSRRPERYFDNEYIEVTGLITRFEGKPEMVIKRSSQVNVY